jgi:hypothetical protein
VRGSLSLAAVVSVVLAFHPTPSVAGERPYAYVQGTESLPATSLELESWFGTSRPVGGQSTWDWWVGPVVGLTDRIELGFFAIFFQPPSAGFSLGTLDLQATYALADRGAWPVDVRVRIELTQPVGGNPYTGWLWLIAGRDFGRINLTGNVNVWLQFPRGNDDLEVYLQYLAGASVKIIPGLRIGVEVQAQTDVSEGETTAALGPSLAAGTGRIWGSASYDFSLTHDNHQGRIVMGMAF